MRRFERFLTELRRRKVFRAAAVYLVGAWAAIQAADTIFPNIGLPPWAITLVIVLAALGLPLALFLAWIFEVGPDGMQRTDALDEAGTRPRSSPRSARLVYGALALAVLPLGWITWNRVRGDDVVLDDNLVTIMPFRVSGAAPDVAHLREGLPDLLAATIGSDSAHSAVPTRTVLAALDRLGRRDSDLLDDVAPAVARELGSGMLVVGEVVQRGGTLEVVASLIDVATGEPRAPVRSSAPADSLHVLVDRLTNQIVATLGGTPEHRLSALTSTSLPAVEAYLRGQSAYRLGRYDEALRHYDMALDLDSTFALAALGMHRVSGWTPERTQNTQRAIPLLMRYKDQLGPDDRLFVEAVFGTRWPDETSLLEQLTLRRRAAERYPHRAEFWYLLGDGYYHYGALVGVIDHLDRAGEYFDRAIAIDSTYVEPLEHSAALARIRADTLAFRRYSDLLLAVDSTSATVLIHRLTRERTLGDRGPLTADSVIASFGEDAALDLFYRATLEDPGYMPAVDAALQRAQRSTTAAEGTYASAMRLALAMTRGRVEDVQQLMSSADATAYSTIGRLLPALYWSGDATAARAAAVEVESAADTARTPGPACALSVWYARSGQRTALEELAGRFTPDSTDQPLARRTRAFCGQLNAALLEGLTRRGPTSRPALAALDRELQKGPVVNAYLRHFANVEAARLWDEAGRPDLGLAAVRRNVLGNYWGVTPYRVEALLEEGRLAERAGDREAALRAYLRYLEYRTDPQGVFVERAARARARVAALAEEPSN